MVRNVFRRPTGERPATVTRIFIGVAWPYANGPFHIGHLAGAYLPGEIFARYHRLKGDEVLMVSGSDMHGTPTLLLALKEGTTPEAVSLRFDAINREAFERLGFSFDCFTSTHTLVHERTVQEMFLRLLERGFVGRRTEENPYCPKDGRFLPDRYLVGTCPYCGFEQARGDECDQCGRVIESGQLVGPRCSLCGTPVEFRPSEHFYLLLDKLAPDIDRYLSAQTHWRANVANAAATFRKGGLHPTPITRDLDWGVRIPLEGYDAKRFYVWFDAVIGYLSASKEWAIRAGRPEAWKRYWSPIERVRHYYFIGKDNIFHHTILWPGILIGAGDLPLPYDVPANEWLVVGGKKIAKSRPGGADVTVPSLLQHYAPDAIRFYAALIAPQNHDTEFDWDEFHRVHDEILANQYGNLVQRILVMVRDKESGRVPSPPEGWSADAPGGVGERLRAAHAHITEELEAVHLKEALELALGELREENRRFHEAKPWQATEAERRRALYEGLWVIQAAAVWLAPYLPFSSSEVFRMLGFPHPPSPGDWAAALLPPEPGRPLGEVRPLFPRRERSPGPRAPAAPATPASAPTVAVGGGPGSVRLAIRAARILEAAPHPSADRLYVLTVDAGEEHPRTIVAGIRGSYTPEELRGRRIALLSNLEPRTIRSVTSQGMLLAAESEGRVRVMEPPESVPPGTLTYGVGTEVPVIAYDAFATVPLVVGRVVGPDGPDAVRIDVGGREVRAQAVLAIGENVVVRLDRADAPEGEVVGFGPGLALRAAKETPPGAKVR
jgi:methionyl-tRNA synthetase